MKYEDLLKQSSQEVNDSNIPFELAKAKLDMQKSVIVIEQEIAELDLAIQKAKSAKPFRLNDILNAVDEKALKERKLAQARTLQEELF